MSSQNHRSFEIVAVSVTALGKFLFYDVLNLRLVFILLMFGFWSTYITMRVRNHSELFKKWGFRVDNFNRVLRRVLPFGIVSFMACLSIGYYQDTINITWHIIPILILYPVFGVLQQFLIMALVAGNLQELNRIKAQSIIIITSILFGILHYPDWWLVLGTFILALFYTYTYLKNRNLYVLGFFHGWLGALFYYTVVDKDPFTEIFGFIF
ncbi:CPBP family glutamic-type intramembrane protease [Ekhidna sp.]